MKCRVCKKEVTSQNIKDGFGIKINYKEKNIYFCSELHCGEYFRELKSKEVETKIIDEINEYVKKNLFFYDDSQKLPTLFYNRLKDLRNGTCRNQGKIKNGRKEGYGYEVILETFKSARDNILYSFRMKQFSNESGRVNYMFAILENKINDVYIGLENNKKQTKKVEENRKTLEEDGAIINEVDIGLNSNFVSINKAKDFSNLL